MRHRGRHLVSDFVGPPSWCRGGRHLGPEVMGAAILDLTSWGPPSWTGSDVKNSIVPHILLFASVTASQRHVTWYQLWRVNR